MSLRRPLPHVPLGRLGYDAAWALQREAREALLRDPHSGDRFFTVEHDPVLTAGRRARPEHLVADADALRAQGVVVRRVERGGDWTYHGPGQLVGYPIVALPARRLPVTAFVCALEEAMIAVVAELCLRAGRPELEPTRRPEHPGAWVRDGASLVKVGAVGVHVARGVTLHGLALNLDPRPDGFRWIVPCGLVGERTTSVAALLGTAPSPAELAERLAQAVEESVSAAGCA